MRLDILFVNPWHAEFCHVPMGTFGLCDYLAARGLAARIVNLAVYQPEDMERVLLAALDDLKPRAVGLILHWKELLHGAISTGASIRRLRPEMRVITGGLTASCYAGQLMERLGFLDYVIRGDAELPLARLLEGATAHEIPNLTYRAEGTVVSSEISFIADRDLLNDLSFSRLEFLQDYSLYLKRLDDLLGFPVPIGRGCVFDCEYCGGSRSAFLKHSGRAQLAVRDPDAVVLDILNLAQAYGCRHVLLSHISALCKLVLRRLRAAPELKGSLTVNLEPWDPPDAELFSLHRAVCEAAPRKPSVLLTVKDANGHPGHLGLAGNYLEGPSTGRLAIDDAIEIAAHSHIDVFKGYFTSRQTSLDTLFLELRELHDLRKRHAGKDVAIHFLAFSTDPASTLTEAHATVDSMLSLSGINQASLFDRNLSTNILLHRPRAISAADQQRFQRILVFSEFLFENAPLAYWLLTDELGFTEYLALIDRAALFYFYDLNGISYEISPSNMLLALHCLRAALPGDGPSQACFVDAALGLLLAHEVARRLRRAVHPAAEVPCFLTLNRDRVFASDYNFVPLFRELGWRGSLNHAAIAKAKEPDPSLYLLVGNWPQRVDLGELALLENFDGLTDMATATAALVRLTGADAGAVEQRIATLHRQQLLVGD